MGIILDVIILSVLALSLILGYRKGLIGVAFNLCAFLVALIITWILYTPITNLVINNTQIDDGIRNTIIEKGVIKEKVENEKTEEKIEEKDNVVNQYIQKYVTEPATNTANNVVEETAKVVSEKVVAIGVAIGLFIVVRIGLILLKFVAEAIAKLPVIKQFNKAGGLIYGAIRGMLIIYVFLAILFFIMCIIGSRTNHRSFSHSILGLIIYSLILSISLLFPALSDIFSHK